MSATDVIIGEDTLVRSFHKMEDLNRPSRLLIDRPNTDEFGPFNLQSEESIDAGTIQLEDATSSESTRDFILLENGVGVGTNNKISLETQILILEDDTTSCLLYTSDAADEP